MRLTSRNRGEPDTQVWLGTRWDGVVVVEEGEKGIRGCAMSGKQHYARTAQRFAITLLALDHHHQRKPGEERNGGQQHKTIGGLPGFP